MDKTLEWYHVYEQRMHINLLEPWEKVLANILVLSTLAFALSISLWMLSMGFSLLS